MVAKRFYDNIQKDTQLILKTQGEKQYFTELIN